MTKTLVIILNHNLPKLTDALYKSLSPFQEDLYDLHVMDNGSEKALKSKFSSIFLEKNIFWGGALNHAFRILQNSPQYDSLLFLNNDIEINGHGFVKNLRNTLFEHDLTILAPCIAGKPQPYTHMQNWGRAEPRIVKWIDNQAPLFHRRIIEKIGQFDKKLFYGWGQELICYQVCKENNWKIAVSDSVTIIHYGEQTVKQGQLKKLASSSLTSFLKPSRDVTLKDFKAAALKQYLDYFKNWDSVDELLHYGFAYFFDENKGGYPWERAFYRTDIINKLITKFQLETYLEIGVDKGINFKRVKAKRKTSVDPNATYDVDYPMSSNAFFEQLPKDTMYDLIFIDGLHTAEQVKLDISNALKYLSPNGFIVVHDCSPTLKAHQTTQPTIPAWTGDVWKGWMYFRQHATALSMYVVDTDWGVGVISRGAQVCYTDKPCDDLTFEDLEQNRAHLLNLVSVDDFLEH